MVKAVDYTVIMANRNDPELINTIANIQETQFGVSEFIVIDDNDHKRGPEYCRHLAIKQTSTDIIIVIDPHMRFAPGSLDRLAAWSAQHPQTVICPFCHHNKEISLDSPYYHGAELYIDDKGISAKWNKTPANETEPEVIQCVMGACYAFSKEWYYHIGAPWQIGRGWGHDEEFLSCLTWLMGGSVWCVPEHVAHQYRDQHEVPYRMDQRTVYGVWFQKFALVDVLPLPEEQKESIRRNLRQSAPAGFTYKIPPDVLFLAEYVKNNLVRTPAMYFSQRTFTDTIHIKQETTPMSNPTRKEVMQRLTAANIPYRQRDNLTTLLKLLKDPENATPLQRQHTTNPVATSNGIKCRHCGHVSDHHRCTHKYPNGNWRALCESCSRPFIVYPRYKTV